MTCRRPRFSSDSVSKCFQRKSIVRPSHPSSLLRRGGMPSNQQARGFQYSCILNLRSSVPKIGYSSRIEPIDTAIRQNRLGRQGESIVSYTNPSLLWSTDQLLANLDNPKVALMDLRPP